MINIPLFKIRCSAIGKIMAYPSKDELPKGAKTYCRDWLKGQLLNRKSEISTRFTEKGNIMEDESIDMIAEKLGYPFLVKNEKHFEEDNSRIGRIFVFPNCRCGSGRRLYDAFRDRMPRNERNQGWYWL